MSEPWNDGTKCDASGDGCECGKEKKAMSEPTEEDLKAAEVWLKANASPDPYGSWRMFEKSTIRLRHDLARFRAQTREEGRIAGAVAMRERAVEIAAQIMRDRAARTVAGMSDSYLVELVEEIRALKSEGEGA